MSNGLYSEGSEIGRPFFETRTFLQVINCHPIENVQKIWPTKMDFGRPNVEIGWKMVNSRLLFLALYTGNKRNALST